LDRNNVKEIDESNYLSEIKNINNKYSKWQKLRQL
jgi:hypothetical protein